MQIPTSGGIAVQSNTSTTESGLSITSIDLLHNLFENSQEFYYVASLDGRPLVASPYWLELLGYTLDNALPPKFTLFVHPDDVAAVTQIINTVLESSNWVNKTELRLRNQNGDIYWVQSNFAPFKDSKGKVIGWLCAGHDITTQKKLEGDLREATEFFDSVINAVPNPIFIKDENHRMLSVNKAHCNLFGLTVKQIMELNDATLPKDELQAYWESDNRALASDVPIENDQKITDANGNQHFVLAKKVAHRLPNGKKVIIATLHDITERKAAADALRKSKEAAESANQAKSAFLSTITHELRTPINGVIGMTSLLLDTPLTESQIDMIQTIRVSSDALLTLINSVLDFSKIEANRIELEETDFNLQVCVEESFDLVASQAIKKDLNLAYIIENDVPLLIRQDVTRVRQILANLLSNAVKFTEKGEIVIRVSSKMLSDSMCELHFSVQDSGMGIPPDRFDRLFHSFSQTDASMSRRYGGTGLGLAISKRLAEMMSGTMWAESVYGRGSTFHFTIQAQSSNANSGISTSDSSLFNGKKVFIISESEATCGLLCSHLERWGLTAQLLQQNDVESLMQKVAACNILIVDSKLQNESLLRFVEKLQHTAIEKPIIIMLVPLGTRPQCGAAGAKVIFVSKPIHASQLYDALIVASGSTVSDPRKNLQFNMIDNQQAQRHPLRILLAEDNSVNQKVAVGLLSRHGYRVDIAGNGMEVLEALERQSYDVIFMDVNMPEMDGLLATEAIRKGYISVTKQPYIIALTANSASADYERCLKAGMNDYVAKPLQLKELSAALSRVPSVHI